jgi:hypothetical protein
MRGASLRLSSLPYGAGFGRLLKKTAEDKGFSRDLLSSHELHKVWDISSLAEFNLMEITEVMA